MAEDWQGVEKKGGGEGGRGKKRLLRSSHSSGTDIAFLVMTLIYKAVGGRGRGWGGTAEILRSSQGGVEERILMMRSMCSRRKGNPCAKAVSRASAATSLPSLTSSGEGLPQLWRYLNTCVMGAAQREEKAAGIAGVSGDQTF